MPTAPLSQPPAAVATTFAVAELFPSVRGCLAVKNDNRESARSSWPSILFSSTSSPLELQASLWASSLNCLHLRLRLRLCLCLSRCGLTNRSAVGWIPPSLVNLLDLKELIKYPDDEASEVSIAFVVRSPNTSLTEQDVQKFIAN
ncbi:4-coumarate--CoA ligase-like [Arachis hypogaea]|nr:4-coumarate--CoA ligase-like [Arachis hypogaea]